VIFEFFSADEQKFERIFPFPSRRWSSKKGASLRCVLLWCAFVFLWWFEKKREEERRRESFVERTQTREEYTNNICERTTSSQQEYKNENLEKERRSCVEL